MLEAKKHDKNDENSFKTEALKAENEADKQRIELQKRIMEAAMMQYEADLTY